MHNLLLVKQFYESHFGTTCVMHTFYGDVYEGEDIVDARDT
jgi:hypothetical protein